MPSALRSTLSVMLCLVNHSISVEIDTTTSGGTSSTQIFPSKSFDCILSTEKSHLSTLQIPYFNGEITRVDQDKVMT